MGYEQELLAMTITWSVVLDAVDLDALVCAGEWVAGTIDTEPEVRYLIVVYKVPGVKFFRVCILRRFVTSIDDYSASIEINSSRFPVTALKSLYISSASCISGMYAIVLQPRPENHPASV